MYAVVNRTMTFIDVLYCSCVGEDDTVKRDGVDLKFLTGDGVVKNVAPGEAAVFEVCQPGAVVAIFPHGCLRIGYRLF
jgi:hypothetical protein